MSPVAVDKATEEGAVTEYELPACAFTPPEGMEFDGWSVEGTKYPAGGKIILTASKTTVKAEWKKKDVDPDAKDCVVTYDPGEGTGEAIVEEGHKVGEWLKLPECTFTAPEGMEFDAWQKGEQKAAPGEEIYLDSEAVTITALWKEKEPEPDDPTKPWTITFDANGGTGTMDPVTVPKAEGGTTYTLPACGFTAPEGKTFQAWKFDGDVVVCNQTLAKHLVGFGIFRRIIYLTVLGAFYLAFEFSYKFYILSVVIHRLKFLRRLMGIHTHSHIRIFL